MKDLNVKERSKEFENISKEVEKIHDRNLVFSKDENIQKMVEEFLSTLRSNIGKCYHKKTMLISTEKERGKSLEDVDVYIEIIGVGDDWVSDHSGFPGMEEYELVSYYRVKMIRFYENRTEYEQNKCLTTAALKGFDEISTKVFRFMWDYIAR